MTLIGNFALVLFSGKMRMKRAHGVTGCFVPVFRRQTDPTNSTMRFLCAAFGSRVRAALKLSTMYSGLSVPGSTALTASAASRYLRKNWPQVGASNSALAQSGTALPCTARNRAGERQVA